MVASEALKGGAIAGATGGAFKGLGISLEKLGQLLPKYGKKVMNKTLQELGVPEAEIPKVMEDISKYSNPKNKMTTPDELAKRQSEELRGIKGKNDDTVWTMENLGEGKDVQRELESIRSDTAEKVYTLKETNRIAKERLKEATAQLKEDHATAKSIFDPESREAIQQATLVQDAAVKKAESELHNATGQVFGSLYQKLQTYKKGIDDTVQKYLDEFYRTNPTEGVKVSTVGQNISEAINAGRVLSAKFHNGVIQIQPKGINNAGLAADAKSLEGWLNAFLSTEEDGAIRTLKNLHFNHQDISNLVGSKLGQGGVSTNVGDTIKLIKSALDPEKYLDDVRRITGQTFANPMDAVDQPRPPIGGMNCRRGVSSASRRLIVSS
jgi:hypothetical protein